MMKVVEAMDNPSAIISAREIELEPQDDAKKSVDAAIDGKDTKDEEQSLQSLTIEIDPLFFIKEIVDSKTDNILSILTDGFRIAQELIKKQRERLLHDDNFVFNNESAINREITRGTNYSFD